MNYIITSDTFTKCYDFANSQIHDTNSQDVYKARKGTQSKKRLVRQVAIGKMAEFAAMRYLNDHTRIRLLGEPDLEVVDGEKKYDPDLKGRYFDFHVKCSLPETEKEFGLSWIFTKNDPVTSSPKHADSLLLVRCVKDTSRDAIFEMVYSLPALRAQPHFKPLKMKELNQSKVALYDTDLIEYRIPRLNDV